MKSGNIWQARAWLEDATQEREKDKGDAQAYQTLNKGLRALEFLRALQGELAGEELGHKRVRPRRLKLSQRIDKFLKD